ncbi:hypothetical protein F0A99_19390 [Salmonella enterica]|nr:hypothetical protein [Salmonella enterica]EFE4861340.1 hypothetical protein [Escherichia coli]HDT0072562.1 hypothetical protein [Klebsiella pneumoniae subsp. pneumoniae]ECQ3939998.1 hypothetical protein [Salmonella enterica]EEF6257235.1 hypothetical protein [Salmonella enterica]
MNTKPVALAALGWFFFGCCLTFIYKGSPFNSGLFAVAAALSLVATVQPFKEFALSILIALLIGGAVWCVSVFYNAKEQNVNPVLTGVKSSLGDDAVSQAEKEIQAAFEKSLARLPVEHTQTEPQKQCINGYLYAVLEDGRLETLYDWQPAGENMFHADHPLKCKTIYTLSVN